MCQSLSVSNIPLILYTSFIGTLSPTFHNPSYFSSTTPSETDIYQRVILYHCQVHYERISTLYLASHTRWGIRTQTNKFAPSDTHSFYQSSTPLLQHPTSHQHKAHRAGLVISSNPSSPSGLSVLCLITCLLLCLFYNCTQSVCFYIITPLLELFVCKSECVKPVNLGKRLG